MSTVLSKGLRLGPLLLLVLLLGACSSTTFIYNRLDFLLPWYVEDYTELDREQEAYLDQLLEPFLAWHRQQELPRYAKVVQQIEDGLDDPQTGERVEAIWREFELAWFRLEAESLEWLLDLGGQLSDEQMADFIDELWQQQAEYEEKYLTRSDQEFYRDSYDNMRDSAQDYLGRLDSQQRDMLRESSNKLRRSDQIWLAERAQWLERLAQLLQREPGWQQEVLDAVAARNDTVSPQYVQVYEHNLDVLYANTADLLNSRSPKQDRHLRNKLSNLRRDLDTLIAQGRKSAPASSG